MTRDPREALVGWIASTGYCQREVGALFGVSKRAVQHWTRGRVRVPARVQAQLRAEGWLRCRSWAHWEPEHDAWLAAHHDAYPLVELARRLTVAFGIPRTPMAILKRWQNRGEHGQGADLLTRARVAQLCGVTSPTIKRWVDRGLLDLPPWARRGIRGWWAVPPAALATFVDTHAVQLDAAAMPPSPYRDGVVEQWTRAHWLDTETASHYAGVSRGTIRQWIRQDALPAVRRYRANAGYLWMVRARDLAAVVQRRSA